MKAMIKPFFPFVFFGYCFTYLVSFFFSLEMFLIFLPLTMSVVADYANFKSSAVKTIVCFLYMPFMVYLVFFSGFLA